LPPCASISARRSKRCGKNGESGPAGEIISHAGELSEKLLKPTDKKHVPEGLRAAVAALLDAINLESSRDTADAVTKRTQAF
jgi:hypothetical protein